MTDLPPEDVVILVGLHPKGTCTACDFYRSSQQFTDRDPRNDMPRIPRTAYPHPKDEILERAKLVALAGESVPVEQGEPE